MRFSRHHTTTLASLVVVAMWLLPFSIHATTYHVSLFGSDTPPYDTFEKSATHPSDANALATGYADTVLVHPGEYDLAETIQIAKGVSWIGVSADSVRIGWIGNPDPPHEVLRGNGDNYFRGLGLVNPSPQGMPTLVGLTVAGETGSSSVVTECQFWGCELTKGTLDSAEIARNDFEVWNGTGVAILGPGASWIHENTFTSGPAIWGNGTAIASSMPGWTLIEHNVFDYRPAEGRGTIILASEFPNPVIVRNNLMLGGAHAVFWASGGPGSATGLIENNTIVGPRWAEEGILVILDQADTLVVRNNVFQDFAAIPRFWDACLGCPPTGPLRLVHNVFWPPVDSFYTHDPLAALTVIDSGNFNGYPMFIDDSLYRLQAGSPLIDAGDPLVLDADGSRSDIGWTGGPGGETYVYAEMAPGAPESLWVGGDGNVVTLRWRPRPEADLAGYRLYRGIVSGFWMPGLTPLREVSREDTLDVDTILAADQSFYYVVTAVDTAGLESAPSPEGIYRITGVFDSPDESSLPRTPFIRRVYPNPSNASIVLEIQVGAVGLAMGHLSLVIYNILGRRVTELDAGTDSRNSGISSIAWTGRDDANTEVPSGIYFARLMLSGRPVGDAHKLVLIR